ncbi:ntf2 and rrm domain-containing protein [Zymoseptoria brevis]|uniref:Ntf2 and rrm domain-containing protein n=1 Tax=Zymoseptoria brevis TaxID=1047168 RepID=A0A0F4GN97_9PEZI|nr:ntf2 and rrm domain-containing protein [Zymoseptoria brevis]
MATEHAGLPNGTGYAHQNYEQNAYAYASNNATSQQPTSTSPANSAPSQPEISKDEVGWYFVEQYYTTLSRSPEKLYLFYNKRSQFVSGQETDKVAVCVGQRAINDKIKELDFHDCKVRVTNVDSQASDSHIVIQVIGEISNRSQPHKKFTQTFVLATQTNGYFVLNDIFRYLVEEEDEAEVEAAAPAPAEEVQQVSGTEKSESKRKSMQAEAELKTLISSAEPAVIEQAAKRVDKELEEKAVKPAEDAPKVNGNHVAEEESKAVEETPAPVEETKEEPVAETTKTVPVEEEKIEQEKPKDPEPTPAISPVAKKAAPAQPAQAPKPAAPAAPKTWAQLASARSAVAMPAIPTSAAATTGAAPRAAPAAAKVATPAAPSSASTTPSAPAAPAAQSTPAQRQDTSGSDSQDEWTAVGHSRQQSRQVNAPQQDQPQHRGYIKNVQDNVNAEELRSILQKFGDVLYLDIARQKNCAFVDFKTAEGYNKATATPFELGGETLYVEERRMRPGSTPYVPRGQYQGGRGNGRGGAGGQNAPRGGNFPRGNGAPRGSGGRGGFTPGRGAARGGAQA